MFKPTKRFRFGPSEILIILVVVGAIFLFIQWRKKKDKEDAKTKILADLPAKICGSCGTENEAEAKFCKSCGSTEFTKQEIDMSK